MSIPKTSLVALALVAAVCLAPAPAFAGRRGHVSHSSPTPNPMKPTHEGVIKSINGTSITVGAPNDTKSDHTYGLDTGINGMGGTDVTIDGVKTSIASLKVGMAVTVSGDLTRASSIIAHAAPPADKAENDQGGKKGKKK